MKKFVAILLAVLTVLSATSMMVFAAEGTAPYKCEKCGFLFDTTADYNNHLAEEKAAAEAAAAEKEAETAASKVAYTCDYCGKEFETTAAIKTHIDETFPVSGHTKACPNADKGCAYVFTTKVAYDSHIAVCEFNDNRTDAEKMVDAFKDGDIAGGLKLLVKIIVDFVQSKEFKEVVDKISAFVKGINFDKVVATVKDVVAKIPVDKITSLIKK